MSKTINFNNIVSAFSRGNVAISRIYVRGNNLIWKKVQSYEDMYLTIECMSDGDFTFDGTWYASHTGYTTYNVTLYYSKNGGTWTEINSTSPATISCSAGDKVRFKGINDAISPMVDTSQTSNSFRFLSGDFKAYGNVMSVLFGDNFRNATLTTGTNDYAFKDLFNQMNITNNSLYDVQNLILPDVLTPHCFRAMFQYSKISSAPVLRATALVDSCYRYMFYNCGQLQYIKCHAVSGINTNNSTYNWVQNVAATGTFYKDAFVLWGTGNNGIPRGWVAYDLHTDVPDVPTITCADNVVTITSNDENIIYYRVYGTSTWTEYTEPFEIYATATYEAYATNEIGDSNVCTPVTCEYVQGFDSQYFTVELLEAGSFKWKMLGSGASYTIQYSKNEGAWTSITSDTTGVEVTGVAGDKFRIRGNNVRYTVNDSSTYNRNYSFFDFVSQCMIYGNIMSLINGDNFVGTSLTSENTYAFCSLFKPSDTGTGSYLMDASDLVLPVGSTQGCFRAMFAASKNMTVGPKEVRLTENGTATHVCYYMFQDCDAMTTSPDLPTLSYSGNYAYQQIFNGCNTLRSVKCLLSNPTFTSTGTCYRMFYSVGVANGTLYKNASATWTTGGNGVPTGWTVVNAQ